MSELHFFVVAIFHLQNVFFGCNNNGTKLSLLTRGQKAGGDIKEHFHKFSL